MEDLQITVILDSVTLHRVYLLLSLLELLHVSAFGLQGFCFAAISQYGSSKFLLQVPKSHGGSQHQHASGTNQYQTNK